MNLSQQLEAAEKAFGIEGGSAPWYKISEGANRLRVLSQCAVLAEHFKIGPCYEGCPNHGADDPKASVRWLTWVLDYKDNQMKLAKLPHTIFKSLVELQNNPEYKFESLPMPFDITINAKGAGTKEVNYSVVPARANSDIPAEILAKLAKEHEPKEIVEAMKLKQMKKDGKATAEVKLDEKIEYPENNGEEIPF